jgi:hypothetical protein
MMKSTNIIWLIVRSEIFCGNCALLIIHVKASTLYTVVLVLSILAGIELLLYGIQLKEFSLLTK